MDVAASGNLVVAGALGTAIVLKEVLPFLLKSNKNGNGIERKLDDLIAQSIKQNESLDELVMASRVAEELRKARGAHGQ